MKNKIYKIVFYTLFLGLIIAITMNFSFFNVNGETIDIVIDETAQTVNYSGEAKEFIIKTSDVSASSFDIKYYRSGMQVTPISIGSYDVLITRAADSEANEFNKTITNGLIIKKCEIVVSLETSEFTYNGSDQTSLVKASYKNVNNEDVSLTLDRITQNEVTTAFTNSGDYVAYFNFSTQEEKDTYSFFNDEETYSVDIKMGKAEASIDTTKINCSYVYSGRTYEIDSGAVLNHNESNLYYEDNTFTDAGRYYVIIKADESANYKNVEIKLIVEVEKAEASIDINEITTDYVYDGSKIVINNATLNHNETTINYVNNEFTDAGSYEVKLSASETKNYKAVNEFSINVIVSKAYTVINYDNVVTNYTYDGNNIIINSGATINHNETTLQYIDNCYTSSGSKQLTIYSEETKNYYEASVKVDITINKGESIINGEKIKTSYVYDGEVITIDSGATLNHNETNIIYSNNVLEEIGKTTIVLTVEETTNYLGATKTIEVELLKGETIIDISGIKTTLTYNGKEQTFKTGARLNHTETIPVYTENSYIDAGIYQIMVRAEETDHYKTAYVMVDVEIKKAKYDMSGIAFLDTIRKYTGEVQNIVISGSLPVGLDEVSLEVTYSEGMSEIGSKLITASFTGSDNYEEVADMTATLTIQKATVQDKENNPICILNNEIGFASDVTLISDALYRNGVSTGSDELTIDYDKIINKHQELNTIYKLRLFKNSKTINVSDISLITVLEVKLLIPEELRNDDFILYYVDQKGIVKEIVKGTEASQTSYVIDGDYCLFTSTNLGEYAFVSIDKCNYEWFTLSIIIIFIILFVLFGFIIKIKKDKLIISLGLIVYGLLLVLFSVFGFCTLCTIFDILGFVSLITMTFIFIFKKGIIKINSKKSKNNKNYKPLTKRELAHLDNSKR